MGNIEAELQRLADGNAASELVGLKMTLHKGAMRGSESLIVRTDGKVLAAEFLPAKGVGKQEPPREIGSVAPEKIRELANALLDAGVHLPPVAPPAPGGAEVEFSVAVGTERASLRIPSPALQRTPSAAAAHRLFEGIRKSVAPAPAAPPKP